MPWDVVDLKIIAPLSMLVRFSDGTSGEVRFETSHLTGVFSALKDFNFFKQAFIDRERPHRGRHVAAIAAVIDFRFLHLHLRERVIDICIRSGRCADHTHFGER